MLRKWTIFYKNSRILYIFKVKITSYLYIKENFECLLKLFQILWYLYKRSSYYQSYYLEKDCIEVLTRRKYWFSIDFTRAIIPGKVDRNQQAPTCKLQEISISRWIEFKAWNDKREDSTDKKEADYGDQEPLLNSGINTSPGTCCEVTESF